ncbi:hypothetical protein GLOIN_2v1619353 [Rhizophagus irregularis DAOM 181602=DAOM 197198]|uniref:Uncharacterized protein n=1 Tax=Rhizophagus irregularis (strain DAOM 181602 / DAOM 197198 / MUCL 43194) TaxID=747089 RepID=A0A2P4PXI0_RHIID|nr:hypothetical protein GLOIN_2v1619353 [Rhizophagus irregularis DAOM 181602=DAOM 197198]POG70094.1 hypothetical protein GLOIN_2v1619353 [Rhizophagus irregularis DAOM 181602=DAOM 197198]|eukprot:XP_025176960.1 hypothetical protein GLOIN_2v1619353 [Rhizophagus irregularis DAOM 181602=DAOM 197198]
MFHGLLLEIPPKYLSLVQIIENYKLIVLKNLLNCNLISLTMAVMILFILPLLYTKDILFLHMQIFRQ